MIYESRARPDVDTQAGEMVVEKTTRKLTAKEWRLRQEAIVSKRSEQVNRLAPGEQVLIRIREPFRRDKEFLQ